MPVIKRNYWTETLPRWANEEMFPTGEYSVAYQTSVPTSARALKLVCSFGITLRGAWAADIESLGLPMAWHHQIVMIEPGSDRYPSGRVKALNRQAGTFRTSQVSQKHLDPPVGDSETIWSKVVTMYTAEIQQIDQSMSYGSVDQNIGDRVFAASFTIIGTHGVAGGSGYPAYKWSGAGCLRVLFEKNFTDTGGPWWT